MPNRLVTILIPLIALLAAPAAAGPPVEYTVSLHRAPSQIVEIAMRLRAVDGPACEIALPTWRPGRYRILDPAGTVRAVEAFAGSGGGALAVRKIDKSRWRIDTGGATDVLVRYRLYANSIADRTRHADDSHAFLSGSSVFMYAPERRAPARVRVEAPPGWRVATGLEPDPADGRVFLAADYDVLVDSPLEIGVHDVVEFAVDGASHEIVVWPAGIDFDAERLREDFARVVRAQTAIFGRRPYERYVFIVHAGGGGRGGTEHLNSTIMQTSRCVLEESGDEGSAYKRFLGLVSHEFFHTWNVKQLRPAGIHPYDYQRENYSTLFWVAEGTTSYYTPVTLVRAELRKPKKYLSDLGEAIDAIRRRPGANVQSLAESSFDAWINHHAEADSVNSTVSFYDKGALVSLLLDLELRSRTGGAVSLDGVMRTMFERFPLDGPGFTPEDLLGTLETMSGTSFRRFYDRYVRGTDELPFETALAVVGLELRHVPDAGDDEASDDDGDEHDPDAAAGEPDDVDDEPADAPSDEPPSLEPYLGLTLRDGGGGAVVRTVLSDGPAYAAGIIAGDEILALDGRRLRASALDDRLGRLAPGDVVTIQLFRRDELRTFEITLAGRPAATWKVERVEDPTDAQKQAYESWLGVEWPASKQEQKDE